MDKKSLFLSFTSLLRLIKGKQVTQDELNTGLFYFGCTRNHIFNPFGYSDSVVMANVDEDTRALEKVWAAIFIAEIECRAVFRESNVPTSYAQLYGLLEQNGLDLSLFVDGKIPAGVAQAMGAANIDIDEIKDSTTLRDLMGILDMTHYFQFSHPIVRQVFSHIANVRS